MEQQKPYYDIKSIRINLQPLIKSITNHAVEWRNTLGNILADKTRTNMMEIKDYIKVCCCGFIFITFININVMKYLTRRHLNWLDLSNLRSDKLKSYFVYFVIIT